MFYLCYKNDPTLCACKAEAWWVLLLLVYFRKDIFFIAAPAFFTATFVSAPTASTLDTYLVLISLTFDTIILSSEIV